MCFEIGEGSDGKGLQWALCAANEEDVALSGFVARLTILC